MPPLPVVSGRKCVAALSKIGFLVIRQRGSHMIIRRDEPRTTITVPDHPTLDRGTLRAIIRQAGQKRKSSLIFSKQTWYEMSMRPRHTLKHEKRFSPWPMTPDFCP